MKLKLKRMAVYTLAFYFAIGNIFFAGNRVVKAQSSDRVHVYREDGTDLGNYSSIEDALNEADGQHKTIVELLDAEYSEFITIEKANVTLKSKDSTHPATLKGTEIGAKAKEDTMISIEADNVTVDSVNITGLWLTEPSKNVNPVGIRIAADNATVNNCKIYDMGCKYTDDTVEGTGFNGHGIICSNEDFSSEEKAIKNPKVINCELYGLVLGNSEALVMNGNVTGFDISNNIVHDCDNIGIDIIGYEKSEESGYSDNDRARDGIVANNTVYNISSGKNLTYRKSQNKNPGKCAGGIYVDGGYNVTIKNNYVENCDIGVELASEHGGQTTDSITLINNILINNNALGGISIGGSDDDNGNATNLTIQNNTVYNEAVGCFRIQKADCKDNVISKNIFIAVGDETETYVKEEQAGTNNIRDNYITKASEDYSNVGDTLFEASKIHFDKETGTITFDHDGYDLSEYGATKNDENPAEPEVESTDKKENEPEIEPIDKKENEPEVESTDKKENEPEIEPIDKKENEPEVEPIDKKENEPKVESTDKKDESKVPQTNETVVSSRKSPEDNNVDPKQINPTENNNDTTTATLSVDQIISDNKTNGKYKITKLINNNGKVIGGNVTFLKPIYKNSQKITIKNSVILNGVKFKITVINNKAFMNCKKLKTVSIGKYVTKIGKKAFYNCKKLKTIKIKSTNIKTIGKKAFSKIHNNTYFQIPKKCRTKTLRLITKSR